MARRRPEDRSIPGIEPTFRLRKVALDAPLGFAQDRRLPHTGLPDENDAGRSLIGLVMRDIDQGFDGKARFVEVDPESRIVRLT